MYNETTEDEFDFDPLGYDNINLDPDSAADYDADKRGRVLKRARFGMERDRTTYEGLKADLDDWLAARLKVNGKTAEAMEGWLQRYHAAELGKDSHRTVITLPSVTLKTTKAQPKWNWLDDEETLSFLETDNPELLREVRPPPPPYPVAIDKAKLKGVANLDWDGATARVVVDGAVVPGVTVSWEHETMAGMPRKWEAT